ncbi:TIGR03089 family protein [Virgisporangium aurantiacum]|uniref:AMP-dependent synthetase/ligase domain-containing protein n=1 Tax=Virgisporangium aurantiacum TaxID=175570 RepID=A0A8J4DY31_9ACTN|nr:TIGR03089 family protein [Virgisporangium aurantiacum]GIJ52662.1 hypothetical protein Vau01_001780 [Virgisporangium aurantiacum]
MSVPALFSPDLHVADRPMLTFYDDRTGERRDLTAAALGELAGRVARLLREGCGLRAGARVAVKVPPHWQTAAVILGAWSVGAALSFRLSATAGLKALDSTDGELLDAVFVERTRIDDWLDDVPDARHRFVLGLAPGGAPLADVPDGYRDLVTAMAEHPGTLPAYGLVRPSDAASADGTSFGAWGRLAGEIAGRWDLHPGDRVLIDANEHEHPFKWLLTPLSVGATVVLCANLDRAGLDARIAAERVTRVMADSVTAA